MQQALPYKSSCLSLTLKDPKPLNQMNHSTTSSSSSTCMYVKGSKEELKNMVKDNAVIVVGRRGCCMSHVVKRLLQCLGANPAIYDIEEQDENEVIDELENIVDGSDDRKKGGRLQLPAVFVGGELFGGLDRIMAAHITGELTPVLKQAGALWL
ncbi:glutaredoxin-C9-like [Nicotiana tabacum]|uniref:Glutaredoxin-C9-like n=2 Tax=Nicotiana TaxID=4085 RepID=A0A1S4BQ49_TOBAC|nr:PREDICTED: glutaredoxin-C9-like [Nicotiana sylvestris]XP_016491017.1 PREDICTED: glutaredoxin-C9-like [Nicotiana tabacum]